jgi:hypothetical protein
VELCGSAVIKPQ